MTIGLKAERIGKNAVTLEIDATGEVNFYRVRRLYEVGGQLQQEREQIYGDEKKARATFNRWRREILNG